MEAALAEMAIDTIGKDVEDDIEFVNDKGLLLSRLFTLESPHWGIVDEEDVFESDFESTDEEAAKEDEEAGDRAVQDEEKKARKARISVPARGHTA
jgi:vacuolar protein sorting-associated protein 72